MGGKVIIAGKPQPPIYNAATAKVAELAGREIAKNRLLAIGDGLQTDMKGAAINGIDAYFITDGIHATEIGDLGNPANIVMLFAEIEQQHSGIRLVGICNRLRWT